MKMGRLPSCSKEEMNKGAWTAQEDKILKDFVTIHGERKWSNVAKKTGQRKKIIIMKLKCPLRILY